MPERTSFGLRDRMKLNPRSRFYEAENTRAHNARIVNVFPEDFRWDFDTNCDLCYNFRDILPHDEKRTT